jgi:hypothetical protein
MERREKQHIVQQKENHDHAARKQPCDCAVAQVTVQTVAVTFCRPVTGIVETYHPTS